MHHVQNNPISADIKTLHSNFCEDNFRLLLYFPLRVNLSPVRHRSSATKFGRWIPHIMFSILAIQHKIDGQGILL